MEFPFKTQKHMFSNPPQSPFRKGGGGGLWPFLLVAAFAFLLYLNALGNGFVRDDLEQVVNNGWIRSPGSIPEIFSSHMWGFNRLHSSNYYRPFIHLIYMAAYFLFGPAPWGFHLVNVLFHSMMSGLVFLTAREVLGEQDRRGFFSAPLITPIIAPVIAGLLFASHPIHTEAVDWISAVSELSFSFFFLLSFYLYIRSERGEFKRGLYACSIISFAVSVLCKETGLLLPFVLFIYDYAVKRRRPLALKKYLPYLAVIIAYLAARSLALRGIMPAQSDERMAELGPFGYLINAFYLFVKYMEKLLLPLNLNGYYTDFIRSLSEPRGYISLALSLLFVLFSFIAYKRERKVFFSLAFMALTLLPALYIRALYGTTFAERYLYLPSFAFVLLFAILLKWAANAKVKAALYAGLLILVSLYSVGTIGRNPVWKDNVSFWRDNAIKSPGSDYVRTVLGFALLNAGRLDEAEKELLAALRLNPDNHDAHCHLGAIYGMKDLNEAAIRELLIARSLDPVCPDTRYNLGIAYAKTGDLHKAIEEFKAALKLDPYFSEAREGLAEAYRDAGISIRSGK